MREQMAAFDFRFPVRRASCPFDRRNPRYVVFSLLSPWPFASRVPGQRGCGSLPLRWRTPRLHPAERGWGPQRSTNGWVQGKNVKRGCTSGPCVYPQAFPVGLYTLNSTSAGEGFGWVWSFVQCVHHHITVPRESKWHQSSGSTGWDGYMPRL